MTLGDLTVFLVVVMMAAWWWRIHGIREQALLYVRQHCERQDVKWLDDTVAWKRYRLVRDRGGRRRVCREYGFEFTVTGEERYDGTIRMCGRHLLSIEMEPHRFDPLSPAYPPPTYSAQGRVVSLDEWRHRHKNL